MIAGGGVAVRRTPEGIVGFAGLSTCGRVWLCPVCNAKIMAQRALEVGAVLAWAAEHHYLVVWGSLTVHHTADSRLRKEGWLPADPFDVDPGPLPDRFRPVPRGDRVREPGSKYRSHRDQPFGLLDVKTNAWAYLASGRTWKDLQAVEMVEMDGHPEGCPSSCTTVHKVAVDTGRDGIVGTIRAAEITVGSNGWHPHFHPIVIVRGSAALAGKVAEVVVRRWVEGVRRTGHRADYGNGAQKMTVLASENSFHLLNQYVTKGTYRPDKLALEATHSQGKTDLNRHGKGRAAATQSHWAILNEAETGDVASISKWWHLEEASHGHRIITWSRGIRDFAGLGVEATEEEIAAREVGTAEDTVCVITAEGWAMVRDHPGVMAEILDMLAQGGWAALRQLLGNLEIPFHTLDELASV